MALHRMRTIAEAVAEILELDADSATMVSSSVSTQEKNTC